MNSDYTVIKCFTLEKLIVEVSHLINEGWVPVGSAQELQPAPDTPVSGWFMQTLVRSNVLSKEAKPEQMVKALSTAMNKGAK